MPGEMMQAALQYVGIGWPVFPVDGNKKPMVKEGVKAASLDPKRIQGWWGTWPTAAIGCHTGAAGLVVIDCDIKNGINGIANFERLCIDKNNAPIVITPSGGKHIFFKDTTGGKIKPSIGKLVPGVDIRGGISYVILPPSKIVGGEYKAIGELVTKNIPCIPTDLAKRLLNTTIPVMGCNVEDSNVIHLGIRNQTLTSLAGTMRRKGMTENEIFAAMMVTNTERCQPPLQEDEVNQIIKSVCKYAPEKIHNTRFQIKEWKLLKAVDAFKPRQKMDWIVEGLFLPQTVNIIAAEGGTGKTWLGLSLCSCIARGVPWLGRKVLQGSALYVDEEMGENFILDREVMAIRGIMGDDSLPIGIYSGVGIDLREQSDLNRLDIEIQNGGYRFVVLDSLSSLAAGMDENNAKDTAPMLQSLREIARQNGACIILMHHTNKSGIYRGSTDLKAKVDLMLVISGTPDNLTFKFEKNRHGSINGKFYGRVVFKEDMYWMEACEKTYQNVAETAILNYLEKVEKATRADIMACNKNIPAKTLSSSIYRLMDELLIYRVNPHEKGQGVQAIYARN
jgi:hypothetical protein